MYISFAENLTKYFHKLYAFFGRKRNKKTQTNQLCVITPVVTLIIFL